MGIGPSASTWSSTHLLPCSVGIFQFKLNIILCSLIISILLQGHNIMDRVIYMLYINCI
uniref:Uncharacterized protein n=1 Tax=Rhizophora mucronata TaxID=61149 RepID=A0A2P2P2W5_RHIMU